MSLLQSIKPFWPLLITFILPRAIGYYRALKTVIRTRPPPRPLIDTTRRALNILFGSICVFLFSSLPSSGLKNVFTVTNSRLQIPTDVLFARLALTRPNNVLTAQDELLRSKLTSQALRKLYLRFGPTTLTSCPFCDPTDSTSYLLYHLPFNLLLPHLFHILVLGLATSTTITSSATASDFRTRSLLGALALLCLDLYLTAIYEPPFMVDTPSSSPQQQSQSPTGLFWTASLLRPLILCLYDILLALLIYTSATNRFPFIIFANPSNSSSSTPEETHRRTAALLTQSNVSLAQAQLKLRALGVARNAVVREPSLKAADDEYWRDVVAMEGLEDLKDENGDELLEDEEVQAAMSRAYGNGSIDVRRMRREAEGFVGNVTRGLD